MAVPCHTPGASCRRWRRAVNSAPSSGHPQKELEKLQDDANSRSQGHESDTVLAIFALFDPDERGLLDMPKMRFLCEYLAMPATSADIIQLFQKEFAESEAVSPHDFQCWVQRCGGIEMMFQTRRQRLFVSSSVEDKVTSNPGDNIGRLREATCLAGVSGHAFEFWRLIGADNELEALKELTTAQLAAVCQARTLAKLSHEKALPHLQSRVYQLGLSEHMLWRALAWIRELVPMVIHINLDRICSFFERDTHYRNGFETHSHANRGWSEGGKFGIRARRQWETKLFAGAYDEAEDSERPKYGALNIMNDPEGVAQCHELYGDSYLVLRGIRLRTTLSSKDSAYLDADKLAVPDYYAHVLLEYSNEELREVIRVASARESMLCGKSGNLTNARYKEMQIHGAVHFGKHVERLVAHPRHRAAGSEVDVDRITHLCKLHGWTLSWADEEGKNLERNACSHWQPEQKKGTLKRWRQLSTGSAGVG